MSIAVIVNGSKPERLRHRLRAVLDRRLQHPFTWYETRQAGDGTRLAAEAAALGTRLVVAAGGDGTVQEVVRGVAETQAMFGMIPLGSANDFARCMGIPLSLPAAVDGLNHGQCKAIDLLKANGQWVVTGVGFGLHADVSLHCKRYLPYAQHAGLWGPRTIYLLTALEHLLFKPLPDLNLSLSCDGRGITTRAALVAVNNQPRVGGLFVFTPHARLDDGKIHICIVSSVTPLYRYPEIVFRALRGTLRTDRDVAFYSGTRFELCSQVPVTCTGDGEWLGMSPHWTVEIVPQILPVWVSISSKTPSGRSD